MVKTTNQYMNGIWLVEGVSMKMAIDSCKHARYLATGLEGYTDGDCSKGDAGIPAWEAGSMTEGFGHCLNGVWCQSDDL
jgi:hypothetical protein